MSKNVIFGFNKAAPEKLIYSIIEYLDGIPNDKKNKEKKWVEENNIDVSCSAYYSEGCLYSIGYDRTDDKINVEYDSEFIDRITEDLISTNKEFMFLIDFAEFVKNKVQRIELPLWENRLQAKTKKESIQYLARAISSSFPKFSKKLKEEMKEYAEQCNIPLDISLIEKAALYFDKYDCPSWNSSSKFC